MLLEHSSRVKKTGPDGPSIGPLKMMFEDIEPLYISEAL